MTITRELAAMTLPEGTSRWLVVGNAHRPPLGEAQSWTCGIIRRVRVLKRGGVAVLLEAPDKAGETLETGTTIDVVADRGELRVVLETDDAEVRAQVGYIESLDDDDPEWRCGYGPKWWPTKAEA